jgi:hypothetical protein|tara:strand:+ start:78 stop:185 length:108 start_codon:yes stop_codon:yes gene_type:complete
MATSLIYDYGNVMKKLEHSVIALALQATSRTTAAH